MPEIIALYVFGSRARGTARPDSDLDLAIEVDGGSFGPLVKFVLKRAGWIDELRALTGISVKDLELIEVSRSVKDPVEIFRRTTCDAEAAIAQELEARGLRTTAGSVPLGMPGKYRGGSRPSLDPQAAVQGMQILIALPSRYHSHQAQMNSIL
jgi:predicted nucleotidyltransferase